MHTSVPPRPRLRPSVCRSAAAAAPLLSEKPLNFTKKQSAAAALLERADFLRPHYRWAPLHTSCTQAVLDDHEALICLHDELIHQQQQQKQQQKQRRSDGKTQSLKNCNNSPCGAAAAGIVWQDVARSRAVALREFIAEHRSIYGDFDAEPLARIESCLHRLERCLLRVANEQEREEQSNVRQSSLSGGQNVAQAAASRTKHISFAQPLFRFFFSSPALEDLERTKTEMERMTLSMTAAEHSDHYQGRTSGVYYGSVSHPVPSSSSSLSLSQQTTPQRDEADVEEEEEWEGCEPEAEVAQGRSTSQVQMHHSYDFVPVNEAPVNVACLDVRTAASLEAMATARRMRRSNIHRVRLLWALVLVTCLASFVFHWKLNQE